MPTEYYIAGYDFQVSSNFFLNGDMEVNSNWATVGDNTSSWVDNNQIYEGQYSRGFFTSAASLATFKIFTNSIYTGTECYGLPLNSKFCLTDSDDLIYYNFNNKTFYHCDGLSTDVKTSFLYPDSLYVGAITFHKNNLYIACYSDYDDFGDSATRILKMSGVSGVISQVSSHQFSGIRAMTFDNNDNLILAHEGWYYYFSYSWRYGLSKTKFGQYAPDIFFRYYGDYSGPFSASIIGLDKASDNNLFGLLSSKSVIKFTNCSTVVLNVYNYSAAFSGDSHLGIAFISQYSTVLMGQKNAISPNSSTCNVIYGFPCWSTTLDSQLKYSYLKHSGTSITVNSGAYLGLAVVKKTAGNNFKVNIRHGDGVGFHYQSPPLALGNNEWLEHSFVFTPTISDSSAFFELVHYGQSSAEAFLDSCRLKLNTDYASLGVLQIYPEWNLKRFNVTNKSDHRTKGGKLYSYKWGDYTRFEIDLTYVQNSKAAAINSWWATDALIYFKIYSGGVWEVNTAYLMNDNAPFAERAEPYLQYKNGRIELESF